MNNMLAKTEQLDTYAAFLEQKAAEFNAITTEMKNIIAALEGGWSGKDAGNFTANANAYLSNIKTVEEKMKYYGNEIKSKSAKYNNICANFYDILGK